MITIFTYAGEHTHGFDVLRDEVLLFECETETNAKLAMAEIERLESRIAELEAETHDG